MSEETLFHEARVRTPVERAAFLDANCADPEMRLRVEGLLKAHDAGGAMGRLVITGVYTPEPGATEDQPAQTEQAGERIGSYKLLQKLGEGGMGAVWVAEQSEPVKRRVAVKLIKAGMDSTQVLRRFEAERQALALMDHQHIAKVLDAGTTPQGRPYFAMELIKGIPITKYCDEEHLTPRERLELFIPVCHAVQHAHQKGVIHRDLKPSNVLIALYDGKPVPKVIDFGVAKATSQKLTEGTMYTEVGQIVGTLEYMAPEQAELNNLDIDTRADIYSLGVILYELLAGSPPFTSKQLRGAAFAEMLRMIREVEPPKPSTRISSSDELPSIAANRKLEPNRLTRLVHGDLDWIVMKALEKDRARRYETANGLAMDVQRYLANEPVSAGKPSALHRLRKFARRNRGPVIAASLIFAALVVGVVGTTGGLFEARRQESMARNETEQKKKALRNEEVQRKLAVEAKEIADGARAKAVAEQQRAESLVREASRSDFATAQARLAGGKWQEGMAYLERSLRYDSENTNARDAFWLAALYGVRDDGRMPRFELRHERSAYFACSSPDGTLIVTASPDDTVRIWNAETGQPVGQPIGPLGHGIPVEDCSFSPDGRRIVTAAYKTARVWDVETGQSVGEQIRHEGVGIKHASFNPDGTRIVTASFDRTARVWDAETGQPVGAPLRHEGFVQHASFSPDGTQIVTASGDGTARVWDTETGQPVGEPLRHEEGVVHASFSPDGTRIVTASFDRSARVWNAETGQPVGEPLRHEGPVTQSSFSADGTRIVTASHDQTARVWEADTGQPVGDRLRHEREVNQASFSPDGTQIVTASGDGTARVWDTETGQPVREPLRHEDGVTRASFIADGTRIVTASRDKTVRIWDAATVQRVGAPLAHEQWVTQASFSPDGSRIVTASVDQTARTWDAETGQPVGAPLRHADTIYRASFSPDGSRIVTASRDKTARLWSAKTGQQVGEPLRHEGEVFDASFSPDGTRIVTASNDNTARLWFAETGQPVGNPLRHENWVHAASFSPDGTRIVTASQDNTARLWDAETGQPLGEPLWHKLSVRCASFSPDGRRIVTASEDYTAQVWDVETGQPVGESLRHELEIHDASFSADGTRIVTASNDKTARIWDARTGRPVGEPLRHESSVFRASFSADGTRIVTAIFWLTAQVWDAETGQPLGEAFRHQGAVVGASFSPDSRRIITASDDGIARVWEWKPTRKLDVFLLSRLARFLTGAILDPELGTLKPISHQERLELWKDLEPALADSPEWLFLARTVFPRSPDSPISPRGMMTIRDAATRLICTGRGRCLDEARSIDPRHPLIQIARARPEGKTPARAEFLREYGTTRLPDDAAVCREAAIMLVEQKDKLRAAHALDKATKLDPKHPDLIRLREALEAE